MPNLRTILEDLAKNIQGGELTAYSREMIEEAEKEIEGLMLDEFELFNFIGRGRADENGHRISDYAKSRYVEKIANAIHSAMLKKLEE